MVRFFIAAVFLLASLGSAPVWAHGGEAVEPCHLLCVTDTGRAETAVRAGEDRSDHLWLELRMWGIAPYGSYTSTQYAPIPPGASAGAVQALPSLTWFATDRLTVFVSFPFEYNYAKNTVLPVLIATDTQYSELAGGRFAASVQARLPDAGAARVWAGIGYGLSNPIGTVDVRPLLHDIPQAGIEGLGIGSDDLYFTMRLAPQSDPEWESSVALEVRLHSLPRWERLYGTTVAYDVWLGRRLPKSWTVGVSLGGFHTMLQPLFLSQSALLQVRPTAAHYIGDRARVTFGVSAQVPGTALNTNTLQTVGVHTGFGVGF